MMDAKHIAVRLVSIFILVLLILSSCVTNKDTVMLQSGPKIPEYPKTDFEHYKLIPNDEISFLLFSSDHEMVEIFTGQKPSAGNSQINTISYRIQPNGSVVIPFLREVPIAGLTIREAQTLVSRRLRELIPDVEVKLGLINNFYYVLGDSHRGQFPVYKDKITIYEALAQAGDVSKLGDKRHVRIVRQTPGGEQVKAFDLRSNDVIDSEYYYIQPNDVIYIQQSKGAFFRVTSFASFVALISTSLSFLVLALSYLK